MLINNNAARVVDRYLGFREGIAYGIDQLLEPPGLGAHCDTLENRTTYVSEAAVKLDPPRSKGASLPFELALPLSLCPRAAVDPARDFHHAPTNTTTR